MKRCWLLSVAERLVMAVVLLTIGGSLAYDSAIITRWRLARVDNRARVIGATNMAALRAELASVADAKGVERRRRSLSGLGVLRIDGTEYLLPADSLPDHE